MRFIYFMICLLSLLLIFGCSKKQEEAEQLEKELLGQDTISDTMVDSSAMAIPDDTMSQIEADAGAIPEEEVARVMPQQPSGSGYTVQVASCEDESYAEYLVNKYTSRGYEPFVTTITYEGQLYYRVRIGLFENYSEAKNLKAELIDSYSVPAWIDKVNGF